MAAPGFYFLRLVSIMTTASLFLIADSTDVPTSSNGVSEAFNCPSEVCRCGLDPRGRVKVVCDRGELGDPIPIRAMDPLTEVLIINAPDDKPNSLTIGPIFQVDYLFYLWEVGLLIQLTFDVVIFLTESDQTGRIKNNQFVHSGHWQTFFLGSAFPSDAGSFVE